MSGTNRIEGLEGWLHRKTINPASTFEILPAHCFYTCHCFVRDSILFYERTATSTRPLTDSSTISIAVMVYCLPFCLHDGHYHLQHLFLVRPRLVFHICCNLLHIQLGQRLGDRLFSLAFIFASNMVHAFILALPAAQAAASLASAFSRILSSPSLPQVAGAACYQCILHLTRFGDGQHSYVLILRAIRIS